MTEEEAVPVAGRVALPRPDVLTLTFRVDLNSEPRAEADDFGWEVWTGTLTGRWWTDRRGGDPLPPDTRGWCSATAQPTEDGSSVGLDLGRVEVWVLRLEEDHPSYPATAVAGSASAVFEAADALSQDLHDTVVPLLDLEAGTQIFSSEVADLAGDWVDQLVVLREVEVASAFRGTGAGAWAASRAICVLARDEGSLVVAKAAPLRRDEFLTEAGQAGGEHRSLTRPESARWRAAQRKIAEHWQTTLGLAPLPTAPEILVGSGGLNVERRATLATWNRDDG